MQLSEYRHPWPGVEVRHLATLAAIARTRSFGGAAGELGYVQSAVSQHIADLERVVGTRLIERCSGHRSVLVTPAGELLLEHGRAIITQLQAARVDLNVLESGETTIVRTGICPGVAPALIPRFVPAVALRVSTVQLQLNEVVDDDELPALVERGELDIALGSPPPRDGPFESRPLLRDPFVLLVAAGSQLADRVPPPLPAELAELPLMLPSPSRGLAQVEAQLETFGINLSSATRSSTPSTIQAFVAAGLGVAILPGLAVDAADSTTVAISLESVVLPRTLMLFWHRQRRTVPLTRQLCDVIVASVREPSGARKSQAA